MLGPTLRGTLITLQAPEASDTDTFRLWLAELETTLALEETARELPNVRLCGPEPQWLRLLSFQAPLAVTVERGIP